MQALSEFKACFNFLGIQRMQEEEARCALLANKQIHVCARFTLGFSRKIVGLGSNVLSLQSNSLQADVHRITSVCQNILFHEAFWTLAIMRICESDKVSKGYQ